MRPALPAGFWQAARDAYEGPGRAYHGPAHLEDVLLRYDELCWKQPLEALIALAWHDAVLVPGAHDNELRSAQLAREAIARWAPAANAGAVARMIELTARHGHLSPAEVDEDEAKVLDCDLAIVGAASEVFDAYERGIAQEYSAYPPEAYAAGRAAFLSNLLSREPIFLSPEMRERFEAPARRNLRRSLACLG
jgi:predicted metal-dependent HD superfamily phosphohydrolase